MRTGNKIITLLITTIFLLTLISSTVTSLSLKQSFFNREDEEENWALIVGVGVYKNSPDETVGSIHDAENLYNELIKDPQWDEDHIKLITGENATKINIIKGFLWLDRKEDKNDQCLIYFSSHGGQMPFDLPPFDEADGKDEFLATYKSFKNPFAHLRDDHINFFVNRLESREICMIVECCYAGGFNDSFPTNNLFRNFILSRLNIGPIFENFKSGFLKDVQKQGRVILMCTEEDLVGYSYENYGGVFTRALLNSIRNGFGDLNNDGYISAEEAFNFTKTDWDLARCREDYEYIQKPTMSDDYPGDFYLVETNYHVDLFNKVDSNTGMRAIDHTEDQIGNLWHISDNKFVSPNMSWSLSNTTEHKYYKNMNNSLISNNITIGNNFVISFNYQAEIEFEDKLYFEISSDNWTSYESLLLPEQSFLVPVIIESNDFQNNYNNSQIQIRFRFQSEEGDLMVPGCIYIDDIMIHSQH